MQRMEVLVGRLLVGSTPYLAEHCHGAVIDPQIKLVSGHQSADAENGGISRQVVGRQHPVPCGTLPWSSDRPHPPHTLCRICQEDCCSELISYCVNGSQIFLAATKQLYKWYFPSVRLSITPL